MKKQLFLLILFFGIYLSIIPTKITAQTFYISSSNGNDQNDGLSPSSAWKSITKVNARYLEAGDSLLFKSGDRFIGRLKIQDEGGTKEMPIVISSYDTGVVTPKIRAKS